MLNENNGTLWLVALDAVSVSGLCKRSELTRAQILLRLFKEPKTDGWSACDLIKETGSLSSADENSVLAILNELEGEEMVTALRSSSGSRHNADTRFKLDDHCRQVLMKIKNGESPSSKAATVLIGEGNMPALTSLLETNIKIKGNDATLSDLAAFYKHVPWLLSNYPDIKEVYCGGTRLSREEAAILLGEIEKHNVFEKE